MNIVQDQEATQLADKLIGVVPEAGLHDCPPDIAIAAKEEWIITRIGSNNLEIIHSNAPMAGSSKPTIKVQLKLRRMGNSWAIATSRTETTPRPYGDKWTQKRELSIEEVKELLLLVLRKFFAYGG